MEDKLPAVDLILCRDVFIHFPFKEIRKALANIVASGSKYLLTTTYVDRDNNTDIFFGEFRPVNLERSPVRLPSPIILIDEKSTNELYADKHLGLWKVTDLEITLR